MLGLFLTGVVVRKATSRGAILGAIAGVLVIVWGTALSQLDGDTAWYRFPYHANMIGPISTLVIVGVAWLESLVVPSPTKN